MHRRCLLAVAALLLAPLPLAACLWDSDTLEQERSRFPSVLELITGKFLRHSDAFYQWRVEDRRSQLDSAELDQQQRLRHLDDLAVALDKLGRHDEAIEQMRQAEQLEQRRYETLANLGTFHIHAGRLEEGKQYIAEALEVNPDAHFGREEIQLLLVEYLLSLEPAAEADSPAAQADDNGATSEAADEQGGAEDAATENAEPENAEPENAEPENAEPEKSEPEKSEPENAEPEKSEPEKSEPEKSRDSRRLPLAGTDTSLGQARGFAQFALQKRPDEAPAEVIDEAVQGVLGMMRFGRHDSPILLEALGDLLHSSTRPQEDANLLAARAYLKAALETDGEASQAYRTLAKSLLGTHEHTNLRVLESEFQEELADADRWYRTLAQREQGWIADPTIDPELEFRRLYSLEPEVHAAAAQAVVATAPAAPATITPSYPLWMLAAAALLAAVAVAVIVTAVVSNGRKGASRSGTP